MAKKRSKHDTNFERKPSDFYPTIDERAFIALDPHLPAGTRYVEPCFGGGHLVDGMDRLNKRHRCVASFDIAVSDPANPPGAVKDALTLNNNDVGDADCIITNPPWSRDILHPMIAHFANLKPTWLLFESDWANNAGAADLLNTYGVKIVSVGRLLWIPGTTMRGLKDCSWYLFDSRRETSTIQFVPRPKYATHRTRRSPQGA